MRDSNIPASLFEALTFASTKHRNQRRKDIDASPYINHPIEVAGILAQCGITEIEILQAAILHDTIEDTGTTGAELEEKFGPAVRRIVDELTDDKSLPKLERKDLQILQAPALSFEAKLVKIADKTANARDILNNPPQGWDRERRVGFLLWTRRVVDGCRGVHPQLERLYDAALEEGLDGLQGP